jgi:CheY-like chemotaxis protein
MSMSERRLLAIDDEPGVQEIIHSTAVGLDFDTRVTGRADAFKQEYEIFEPTVIMLDIVMPETDGIELIK